MVINVNSIVIHHLFNVFIIYVRYFLDVTIAITATVWFLK